MSVPTQEGIQNTFVAVEHFRFAMETGSELHINQGLD